MNGPLASFWRGKHVLVTGHSGFKGSWLALWLKRMGAEVTGISLPPITAPNLYSLAGIDSVCTSHFCDIRDPDALAKLIREGRPEIVFHLAAQPLVRESYREPLYTYGTNVMGTANLLDSLRGMSSVKVVVMVTTDKVYRDTDRATCYLEDDPLGGVDPYSASKAASELVIDSYRAAYLQEQGAAIASARAGNVIGGGDWSDDRLIPDAVRAWIAGETLDIRRPGSIRPWQHVLEPLCGYLQLAQMLWRDPTLAGPYNFGPAADSAASVRDVIELARRGFVDARVNFAGDDNGPREASTLMLDVEKAQTLLGVVPRWTLAEAVEKTMDWYLRQSSGSDAQILCDDDFTAFEATL